MKSIAFICGSTKNDGIFKGGQLLYDSLQEQFPNVNWYQCIDFDTVEKYPHNRKSIKGIQLPNKMLTMGINRLFVFPKKTAKLEEELLFLLDPTLINIAKNHTNVAVKVHDIRPMTKYRDKWLTHLMFNYAMPKVKKVDHVIVSTKHMKNTLIERGFDSDIIHVIPETSTINPIPNHIRTSIERIVNGNINLVYVATDRPYKNINFIIRLASEFSKDSKLEMFKFHIVSNLNRNTKSKIRSANLKNIYVHSGVRDISEIYEKADLMLFPSLYEGFGLPIVEAMSMGMPVISNDLEPMKEILGNAGILVTPNDVHCWMSAILNMSKESEYKKIANFSLLRYDAFSPERYRQDVCKTFSQF